MIAPLNNGNGHNGRVVELALSTTGEAALSYARAGLAVFPCRVGGKAPLTPRGFLDASSNEEQVRAWWLQWPEANIGIPTEGFAVIDIDGADNPWPTDPEQRADLEQIAFAVTRTPRGGLHYWFAEPETGAPGYRSRPSGFATDVDLRCAGGYVVVPPSIVNGKPYVWIRSLADCDAPTIPPAWLDDLIQGTARGPIAPEVDAEAVGLFSGVDGNEPVSERATPATASVTGRTVVRDTLPEGIRHNALLRYGGAMRHHGFNASEILAALRAVNDGRCAVPVPDAEVRKIADWWGRQPIDMSWGAIFEMRWEASGRPLEGMISRQRIEVEVVEQDEDSDEGTGDGGSGAEGSRADDPGAVPAELLTVPGFVGDVMELTLSTAPYPNRALAFAGALSLQAHLCARRVRSESGTRPNIYLLALADSGTGKEWPRKVNLSILAGVGGEAAIGDSMVSSAGIEDALAVQPAMLYQTDEIDGLLAAINTARDERYKLLMGTLLRCYSSSGSLYPMRRKSGGGERPAIQQPHLTLLGTAIPSQYYRALSSTMLTNGFFGRMLVVEAGPRANGRDGREIAIPANVARVAGWWQEFRPGGGGGNLDQWYPRPSVVTQSPAATRVLHDLRRRADEEYRQHQCGQNQAAMTLWARVTEHAAKLALLYACSESHEQPHIGEAGAQWGVALAEHVIRRMLAQVDRYSVENKDDADLKRILALVQAAPERTVTKERLLRLSRIKTRALSEILHTLVERGEVEEVEVRGARKKVAGYRATR